MTINQTMAVSAISKAIPDFSTSLTMSSREIAELTGKEHKNVLRVVRDLIDGQILDAQIEPLKFEYRSQWFDYYQLNKRDSLVVVARLSPEFTARVIDRWQELESQIQQNIPKSFPEALRLAAETIERNQLLESKIQQDAPKVEFVDKYVTAKGSMGFRQVCKLLNIKEPEFKLFLIENKIMYYLEGTLTPHQPHKDAGRFETKTGTNSLNNHMFSQAKFTAKGVQWVAGLWTAAKLKDMH